MLNYVLQLYPQTILFMSIQCYLYRAFNNKPYNKAALQTWVRLHIYMYTKVALGKGVCQMT